jgi:hypothetical protein
MSDFYQYTSTCIFNTSIQGTSPMTKTTKIVFSPIPVVRRSPFDTAEFVETKSPNSY